MKLLVSVVNKSEALEAVKGGAHIVDVKNPKEGSLGANFPWVIRQVKGVASGKTEVSATIGDLPNLPGTASLAALGAVVSGADYVKAGLLGVKTSAEATNLIKKICKAVKSYNNAARVIAAGYADFEGAGCLNPLLLPQVAHKAGADGVMIDVKFKETRSKLFNFLSEEKLRKFVAEARSFNLLSALAGSLDVEDVPLICRLAPDVIGVRTAICSEKNRFEGKVESDAVANLVKALCIVKQ